MKNFKIYSAIASGVMILLVLLLVSKSESKGQSSGIERLIAVTQMKAQSASDEALQGAENQRKLVKQQELLRSPASESSKRIAGPVTSESGGRLTARELAREKAVLQQLEANARRAAEVLEHVKRLAAEVERQPRR